jgi:2-oxoglutarate dehydrogenase E2 component (dihydrolipoamide succinyltransferase)
MGESIAEGTIVRWIKKVGESVERDEPLFEISTDKVDAEIPSPAAGVLTEIKVKEGETVPVNSVVATIGVAGEAAASPAPPPQAAAAQAPAPAATTPPASAPQVPAPAPAAQVPSPTPETQPASAAQGASKEDARRQRSSPLVRKIAQEHQVDIQQIAGSGIGGRVTKNDILGYLENKPASAPAHAPGATVGAPAPASAAQAPSVPAFRPGEAVEIEPMSVMRKKIAEHMVFSKRTSAHVYSVFQIDFSTVDRIRREKKAEYERLGVKLTFLSFIAKAAIDALRSWPVINASLDGDNIVYHRNINLGIAVALDWGLIVPVVRSADEKNVLGLTRSIADLAARARAKQLKPEEVQGGTFTITNPGNFGAQFGLPIINQPQVAILGVGAIEKKPVVVNDAIGIRLMGYLTLGYDHRLVDGAVADQFMAVVKQNLENFDAAAL